MTWPAPDLPFAFQNATISADTHPNAHNETNLSLNDNYRPEIIRLAAALAAYTLQSGNEQIAFGSDGLGVLTFPLPFTARPSLVLTPQFGTAAQLTVQINSADGVTADLRFHSGGDPVISESRLVHWIAIGTLL